jgi:glucose/arabinose dehydrogenase
MLYVSTGDARNPSRSADPQSLAGKILRYTPEGAVPADNPTPGSAVFASGLRNVQGLAWDPDTRQLFAADHGPSGFPRERFRRNNDELNAIRAGANYGWPSAAGPSRDPKYVDPVVTWNPAIAPSGLAVYSGARDSWRGSAFVAALRGEHLRRVSLARDAASESGWRVTSETRLFPELGRIRAVAMGPDGFLYFTTSNRDGRGVPRRGDDHVYRLVAR